MEEVAGVMGVHYRTVQRWVGWYGTAGLTKFALVMGVSWATVLAHSRAEAAVAEKAAKGIFTEG
jgi:hypothetical protein